MFVTREQDWFSQDHKKTDSESGEVCKIWIKCHTSFFIQMRAAVDVNFPKIVQKTIQQCIEFYEKHDQCWSSLDCVPSVYLCFNSETLIKIQISIFFPETKTGQLI